MHLRRCGCLIRRDRTLLSVAARTSSPRPNTPIRLRLHLCTAFASALAFAQVEAPETNLVFVRVPADAVPALQAELKQNGVLALVRA
jgi:hypothetical protein